MFDTYRSESTSAYPTAALTASDVMRILRRRAGPLLVTLALVSGATAAGALLLPDLYRSETLILVVPQRVPESYVKATVTAKIEDRLLSITHQILSRTRLERIIQDFDLYAAARRTGVMETIVEDMRRDITVKVVKGDAFRVAYVGDDPRTVMQVTARLASLFIEENLRDREELAEGTNRFLEAQLAEARRRLIDHEKKLQEYRSRFAGELPSQLPSTLQIIQNNQMQMQSMFESVNRDRDRRLLIERQLRQAENEAERSSSTPDAPSTSARQLAVSRAALAESETRLTAAHPDVQGQRRIVRELERAVAAEASDSPAAPTAPSTAEIARQQRVAELRAELEQLDRQLAFKEDENSRLRAAAGVYQQRVEKVPAREAELAELTRDYSTLQVLYQTLLAKHEESKIAADLERQQIGDQFKVLDPPRIAERPFGPRRWLIDLMGVAGALVLALTVVALLEYRDPTVRPRADVRKFWDHGRDRLPTERHSASYIHQTASDEEEVAGCRPSFSN